VCAESEQRSSSKGLFKFPQEMDGKILALALPALGTELADPLLSACDTAFVGRLGVEQLAAVALASSVFTIASLVRSP
jgi:Na+-driven multidrug efflux pump